MDDRAFWLCVRRALLMMVKAIETRYLHDVPEPAPES